MGDTFRPLIADRLLPTVYHQPSNGHSSAVGGCSTQARTDFRG